MTVNFYPDGPDGDDHNADGSCLFCNQAQINGFGESDEWTDPEDWSDPDVWPDPDGWSDPDDWPDPEAGLYVEFAFDLERRRLACVHTSGLRQLGIPELYIRPPRTVEGGTAMADAQLAVFLATGLIHLGRALIATTDFDVPQHRTALLGREVRFWLAGQEPPFEELAANLGPEVKTVIKVDCSLWHEPFFGDG